MDQIERIIQAINQAQADLRRLKAAGYKNDQVARLEAEITRLKAKLEANREAVH